MQLDDDPKVTSEVSEAGHLKGSGGTANRDKGGWQVARHSSEGERKRVAGGAKPKYFDTTNKSENYRKSRAVGNKLLIGVRVGKHEFKALIDSASDLSLIAVETVDQLRLNQHVYWGENTDVTGTNNGIISSSQHLDLRFKYRDSQDTFAHSFLVVKQAQILGFMAIIGNDHLTANEAVIDTVKGELILHGCAVGKIERASVSATSVSIMVSKKSKRKVQTGEQEKGHKGESADNMSSVMATDSMIYEPISYISLEDIDNCKEGTRIGRVKDGKRIIRNEQRKQWTDESMEAWELSELNYILNEVKSGVVNGEKEVNVITDHKGLIRRLKEQLKEPGKERNEKNGNKYFELGIRAAQININWSYEKPQYGSEDDLREAIKEDSLEHQKTVSKSSSLQEASAGVYEKDEEEVEVKRGEGVANDKGTTINEERTGVDIGKVEKGMTTCAIRAQQTGSIKPISLDEIKEAQFSDEEINKIKGEISESIIRSWDQKGVKLYLNPEGLISAEGKISIAKKELIHLEAVYIPKSLRHQIMRQEHESHWAIHPHYLQLCRAVLSRYFWPTFRSDIRKFSEGCEKCQKIRESRTKVTILDFEKPTTPWDMVAMDIIGPIIKSHNSKEFILTIIDVFTRHITLIPLEDQTKESIAGAIEQVYFPRFGSPRIVLTDNGSNFNSALFQSVCRILGITHRNTPPWHPQGNGLIERSNREVKKKLTLLCEGASQNWDVKLPYVEFTYNNAFNSSLNASPNQVLYGRNMRVPLNVECDIQRGETLATSDFIESFKGRIENIWKLTSKWEKGARNSRNARKNVRRKTVKFNIGDEVLYKKVRSKGSRKQGFTFRYDGPYIISDKISDVTYKVRNPNLDPERTFISHSDRLKNFIRYEDFSPTSTEQGTSKSTVGEVILKQSEKEMIESPETVIGQAKGDEGSEEKGSRIDEGNSGLGEDQPKKASDTGDITENVSRPTRELDKDMEDGHFTRSKGKVTGVKFSDYKFDKAGRITMSESTGITKH